MFGNFRHILALIFVALLMGVFYYFTTSDNFVASHEKKIADIDKRTEEIKQEIIVPLNRLQEVTVDTAIFTSPEYKAMQDTSIPLLTPVLVRSNPFLPAN